MNELTITFETVFSKLFGNRKDPQFSYLLTNSLFYYCAGKDPTPIIALYSEISLFIYSDLVGYGRGSYDKETETLYERLVEHGFICTGSAEVMCPDRLKDGKAAPVERATLTEWKRGEVVFLLLYVKGDSQNAYRAIYGDSCELMPKCICNVKYEMNTRHFLKIERAAEYILGYCYDKEHTAVREIKYYGDYGGGAVALYERN